jgi:hypothetical protein
MTRYELVWNYSLSLINDYNSYSTINVLGFIILFLSGIGLWVLFKAFISVPMGYGGKE